MRRSDRLSYLVPAGLLAAALAVISCGERPAGPPSEPAGDLAPAQLQGIADPEILELIGRLFPPGDLRLIAFVEYGQIRVLALGGDTDGAVAEGFDFLQFTLRQLQRGRLVPPEPVTPAEGVVLLFELIFEELGVDGPPLSPDALMGDVAIGLLGPDGGRVTVPSKHAAIAFDPGMLTGPTWVIVVGLPDPDEPGMCPFGFPVDHDCYPLFYDYSIHPESNLAGVPRVGQCVVETGPFAPPSEEVEMRLRIASESQEEPGTLVFWPLVSPPTTVDCSDLEAPAVAAWQGALFDALGPLAGLFRVTPLYANPGSLGGSISSFSPFAPADPETDGEEPPPPVEGGTISGRVLNTFGQPVPGQVVELRQAGVGLIGTAVTDADGEFAFEGLDVDSKGTAYQVRASNSFGSDSERVVLTPSEPDADVTLVLPVGLIDR